MKHVDTWKTETGSKVKAWFVMRRDLEMSQAKFGVQIGHGTDIIHMRHNPNMTVWLSPSGGNRRKIILGVKKLSELQRIKDDVTNAGMLVDEIWDAGLTEFDKPTLTGLVIHPHDDSSIPKSLARARAWPDERGQAHG